MSYTPTTWNTGDTITASLLNHLEGGVKSLEDYDFDIELHYHTLEDNYTATMIGISITEFSQKINNIEPIKVKYHFDDGGNYGNLVVSENVSIDPNSGIISLADNNVQTAQEAEGLAWMFVGSNSDNAIFICNPTTDYNTTTREWTLTYVQTTIAGA